MRRARGLSLIEVVLATAMLGLLAAAVVPLLRTAGERGTTQDRGFELLELSRFADAVLNAPGDFGLSTEQEAWSECTELSWPDAPDRESVTLTVRDAPDSERRWLVFSCGEWSTARLVYLPAPEDVP